MTEASIPSIKLPNFEIVSFLGRGGMASVWKARQISLDRMVAIKFLNDAFATEEHDRQQFCAEAQEMGKLKHPNIVQVYDANFKDGIYYFVMEFVDGYTMGDFLRRKNRLAPDDVLVIAESVAVALDYAWTGHGIVHCDIKPDNIMADADGTLKVTDLGLCRSVTMRKTHNEPEDTIYGTPAYMSPEQIYGDRKLDCRSDIYSLGASLYHLLTGQLLFPGKSDDDMVRCHVGSYQAPAIQTFLPRVNPSICVLVEKMLAKNPDQRYQGWHSVIHDIKRIFANHVLYPNTFAAGASSLASR